MERLGGTAWTRALAPQGRAQRMHKAGSQDQSSRGHPRTQRNQRQLPRPHRAPNSSNAREKRNSRDHLPGRLHSSSTLLYPNRPPQSQSKRYSQMYLRLPFPFPAFPRSRYPRVPLQHPGPGSIQSRKTNRNSLTSLGRGLGLCYAGGGCSTLGSIPGVRAARRVLLDARRGPDAACSSRRGLWGGAGRVAAAAPPAAQLPARPSLRFRRRLPPALSPSASQIGHPPPGAGHRAGAFCVTPRPRR